MKNIKRWFHCNECFSRQRREKMERCYFADQLSWPNHVSDLGGWQSKVSRLYQVGSVPFTILLNKKGEIIKKNLRGPALEAELEKIFGH